jgi:hypothetical protein
MIVGTGILSSVRERKKHVGELLLRNVLAGATTETFSTLAQVSVSSLVSILGDLMIKSETVRSRE